MRIAIVTESFLPGTDAHSATVSRLCRHLQGRGADVLVLTTDDAPAHFAGAQIVRTSITTAAADLEPALRAFAPDVVHLAAPGPLSTRASGVARDLGLPCVDGVAELLCDLDRFDPALRDGAARAALAPAGEVLVGCQVGERAHADLLLDLDARTGVRLVVIADETHRALANQLVPGAAFVAADSADLAVTLASLDVFVQPAGDAAAVQAARHAMAAGVPVVGVESAALLDVVAPGRTGYLFEFGSAEALTARVTTLAGDADLRARLAVAARESIVGRAWDAVGEDLVRRCRTALLGAVAV